MGSWELLCQLGRVPRRLIWDNEGGIGRGRRLAEGVATFAGTLATRVVLLGPKDPESNEFVERRNGWFETSFMPARSFVSPADFTAQFDGWLARANARPVRIVGATPLDRLERCDHHVFDLGGGHGRRPPQAGIFDQSVGRNSTNHLRRLPKLAWFTRSRSATALLANPSPQANTIRERSADARREFVRRDQRRSCTRSMTARARFVKPSFLSYRKLPTGWTRATPVRYTDA